MSDAFPLLNESPEAKQGIALMPGFGGPGSPSEFVTKFF